MIRRSEMERRAPVPEAEFIQNGGRERGGQLCRRYSWVFGDLAAEPLRPGRQLIVVAIVGFPNPGSGQSVIRIELVIDLDVELLPPVGIEVLSRSARGSRDCTADPPMNRRVQAVTTIESVCARHKADQLRYVS